MKKIKYKITFKQAQVYSLIIGAVVFFALYMNFTPYNILNPFYIDWIKESTTIDLKQHYYGWLFFKDAPLTFPLGSFDSLSYPTKISIIYTDSIPIIAVLFKIILKLFSYQGEFQYFGLWGLLSFMLQSYFGMIIARRFIKSNLLSVLIGFLFCLSPPPIKRMFVHTGLCSFWLVLMSVSILLWNNFLKRKKIMLQSLILAFLGFVCSSIHIYLFLMSSFFVFGYICIFVYNLMQKKYYKKAILNMFLLSIIYIASVLLAIYILGGFDNINNCEINSIYRIRHADILTLAYVSHDSRILGKISLLVNEGVDKCHYLGFGVIFLILYSIAFCRKKINKDEKHILLIILAIALLSYFFSLLPKVHFNSKTIFYFKFSDNSPMHLLLQVFRINSRIALVSSYCLFIVSLLMLSRQKKHILALLIIFSVFTQIYDLSLITKNIRRSFVGKKIYHSKLKTLKGFNNNIKILVIDDSLILNIANHYKLMEIAEFAYQNKLKMTNFYFARIIKNDYCPRHVMENMIYIKKY